MKFKEVFLSAWKDYKNNFWLYTKIMILFFVIPSLVFLGIEAYFGIENLTIDTINISTAGYFSAKFLVGFLFSILYTVMILSSSLFNKIKIKDSFKEGKRYYWKYFGLECLFLFLIISGFLLFFLLDGFLFTYISIPILYLIILIFFILLVITLGIILGVYWAFAGVVIIAERKGIINSLRESYHLVKGRWWRTLGYFILFFLIIFLINILISIIKWPTGIYLFIDAFRNPEFYMALESPTLIMQIHSYLAYFVSLIQFLIITPIILLFIKSFFIAMKKSNK